MNDAKHTKGPWHLDPDGYCEYIWGPNNEMVAQIRGVGADLPREANARLIAAAPDLLEACEAIFKLVDSGELVRSTAHDHEGGWAMRQIPLVKGLQQLEAAIRKAEGK